MPAENAVFLITLAVALLGALMIRVRPIKSFHRRKEWKTWKNEAATAHAHGLTTQCRMCAGNIFPQQKVVKIRDKETRGGFLVHYGQHFSLKSSRYRICVFPDWDQKNLGTWNGTSFVSAD